LAIEMEVDTVADPRPRACRRCCRSGDPADAAAFGGVGTSFALLASPTYATLPVRTLSRRLILSTATSRTHLLTFMNQIIEKPRSRLAAIVFDLLDPIPYGFFVGALIFDAIYAKTAEVLWVKAAAWLIALGLLFAVLPRLINLVRVWFPGRRQRAAAEMAGFWLYLFAVAAAIANAFVHSRDAYGVMPEGLWLSCLTVVLLLITKAMLAVQPQRLHTTQTTMRARVSS
jgi:uncharacterized membrane protein